MITLPLHVLPLVYAALLLAAVLLLWMVYDRRRELVRRETRRGLSQCRLCAEWLRHRAPAKLFRCPSCGALNEAGRGNDL